MMRQVDAPMPKPVISPVFEHDVGIRPLGPADIELLRCWRNRDDIRVWFDHSELIDIGAQRRWFARYLKRENDHHFIILWNDGRRMVPVGGVAVYAISGGEAEFGRLMIGEERARGRGIATRAARMLLRVADTELELSRLRLSVFNTNQRALSLYERIGFRRTETDDTHTKMVVVL